MTKLQKANWSELPKHGTRHERLPEFEMFNLFVAVAMLMCVQYVS